MELATLKHCARLSGYSYFPQRASKVARRLSARTVGEGTDWYAVDDPARRVRTLVFAGSSRIEHWMAGMDADAANYVGGRRGHRGVLQAASQAYEEVELLLRPPEEGVVYRFCGHSLGGCIALACALRLRAEEGAAAAIEVASFGSPPVFEAGEDPDFPIVNVIMEGDIVPRIFDTGMGKLVKRNGSPYVHLGTVSAIRPREPDWHALRCHDIANYVNVLRSMASA